MVVAVSIVDPGCWEMLVSGGIFGAIRMGCCLQGVEVVDGGSESPIDGGLYGEPGSEVSDDAVLESVQLSVATPLKR